MPTKNKKTSKAVGERVYNLANEALDGNHESGEELRQLVTTNLVAAVILAENFDLEELKRVGALSDPNVYKVGMAPELEAMVRDK